MKRSRWLVAVLAGMLAPVATLAAGITMLSPPTADTYLDVSAIANDGNSIAGTIRSVNGSTPAEAFRWTRSGGVVGLGDLPGGLPFSQGLAISGDGSVVVGSAHTDPAVGGFQWTEAAGLVPFGPVLGGAAGDLTGISADGSVLVGTTCVTTTVPCQAFYSTTATGPVGLGYLPGMNSSSATGVSPDGQTVIGFASNSFFFIAGAGFVWTAAGGLTDLGALAPSRSATPLAVTNGGAVIAGYANNGIGAPVPVRWVGGSGPLPLGDFLGGPATGYANDLSADGSVIVGRGAGPGTDQEAFIWTAGGGMESLLAVLVARGVTGLEGWRLFDATAVSADGLWVAGTAYNPTLGQSAGFVANLAPVPLPSTALLFGSVAGLLTLVRRRGARPG